MVRTITVNVSVCFLVGCVSAEIPPPSYNFEASNYDVKTAIVRIYSEEGWFVVRDSQFQIVMQKPTTLQHIFTIVGDNPVTVTARWQLADGFSTAGTNAGKGAREYLDSFMSQVSERLKGNSIPNNIVN